jgi:hypothetical protein
VFGTVVTAILSWPAIIFTTLIFHHSLEAPLRDLAWTATLGLGTIVGLLAAWVRVVVNNEYLRRWYRTFNFTVVGLIVGIATGLIVLTTGGTINLNDPLFWSIAFVTFVGCLLLAATIGARQLPPNNTFERDARKSGARPSP